MPGCHTREGFYVYAYLRERDSANGKTGTPYYIGKGKGRRAYKKQGHTAPLPQDKNLIVILSDNMTEKDAHQAEMLLIALHGRVALGTGCLRNRTDGGEGGAGRVYRHSEVTKRRIAEKAKKYRHSEETRRKISRGNRGLKRSAEARRRMSEAKKGNTAFLGRKHSEEARRKMSYSAQRRGEVPKVAID